MQNEPRREHKVPKCYLRFFTYDKDESKINVFWKDAIKKSLENQNIDNFACERDYYRVDFEETFAFFNDVEKRELLKAYGCLETPDFIFEKWFAQTVDADLARFLTSISSRINVLSDGAVCIDDYSKKRLSIHMAFQSLRTDKLRDVIKTTLITEIEEDQPLLRVFAKKYLDNIENSHIRAIFNMKNEVAINFYSNYYWRLYYNVTALPFFTSDEPIIRNIKDNLYDCLYPLTPKFLLVLFPNDVACSFSNGSTSLVRDIIPDGTLTIIKSAKEVAIVNAYQFSNCKRFVFSNKAANEIAQTFPDTSFIKLLKR